MSRSANDRSSERRLVLLGFEEVLALLSRLPGGLTGESSLPEACAKVLDVALSSGTIVGPTEGSAGVIEGRQICGCGCLALESELELGFRLIFPTSLSNSEYRKGIASANESKYDVGSTHGTVLITREVLGPALLRDEPEARGPFDPY